MSHPLKCQIDIVFPTNQQAEQALQVLQVDREPGDRVEKTFSIVQDNSTVVLRVDLRSNEPKMLRVAVSSFYDYLQVVLKTFQEFG
jgi:Transcription factor Pcc1